MQNPSVHNKNRVLVVGTTPDYIHWIRENHPDRSVFITDPRARQKAAEPKPSAEEEILVRLESHVVVLSTLFSHLETHGMALTGVVCFDCESLELAAAISSVFDFEFVSVETVRNCRDKLVSKQIWQKNGIPCPKTRPVNFLDDALAFFKECRSGIVLKPFYGSGSELVFRCKTEAECETSFTIIKEGLEKRRSNPIFKKLSSTEHLMLAEEFKAGSEFSCDILVDGDTFTIIRTAKKFKLSNQPFGTVAGYILPAALPAGIKRDSFKSLLLKSARVLGIKRAICMVDFIVSNQKVSLIELTPRPGGDCLPSLLKTAGDIDIIGMALDIAEKKEILVNGTDNIPVHIGLRIHAQKAGILQGFNTDDLATEKRIKSIQFIREPGHRITMPPSDYDSWLLGHMIIKPESEKYMEAQSLLIRQRLNVDIAS